MTFRTFLALILYIGIALCPLETEAQESHRDPALPAVSSAEESTASSTPVSLLDAEDPEEEPRDPVLEMIEHLMESKHLSLEALWNQVPLIDFDSHAIDLTAPSTLSWSYEAISPEGFELPYSPGVSFETALAAAVLTFQVYEGSIGSATLLYEQEIDHGTSPDITLPPLEDGKYLFVLSAHYPASVSQPGYVCEGPHPEGYCPTYRSRLDSFKWFMQHATAYYDDVEDPSDQHYRYRDESYVQQFRLREYIPLAFGMLEVEIGESETPDGPSNVLFLPGIKGSRLYAGDDSKLWEPFGNHDIEALMLDTAGNSIRSDIHVRNGDIIDKVAGISDIYGSYITFMDELVEDDVINAWEAVPYDWRLSLEDIVRGGTESDGKISYIGASESPYIQSTLEDLAATSKSGKVTIIAHSNGGLVAKELMHTLGDAEAQRLIDDVIFVGVPQSGAPQALNALLFGYEEGLPHWFPGIVSTHVAREFAENSPMGYHLLPSQRYFDTVTDPEHPVIKFESGRAYDIERTAYGDTIDSYEELWQFAIAAEGGREEPLPVRTDQASILNSNLLGYAQDKHDVLDAWEPPSGVTVHQIAGWGATTVAGMRYYEKCALFICASLHEPILVEDGDRIVPVPSALMLNEAQNVNRYWINLQQYGLGLFGKKDHGNLLTINEVRSLIQKILFQEQQVLPDNISDHPIENLNPKKKLLFLLHSPLNLSITDADGNRVGPREDGVVEENIPGVQYGVFAGVQYITAPADQQLTLELDGYASGSFTLEIREIQGKQTHSEITFLEVPVTESTVANMDINGDLESENILEVDIDGDGSIDTKLTARSGDVTAYESEISNDSESSPSSKNQFRKPALDQYNSFEYLKLKLYKTLLQLLLEYLIDQRNL